MINLFFFTSFIYNLVKYVFNIYFNLIELKLFIIFTNFYIIYLKNILKISKIYFFYFIKAIKIKIIYNKIFSYKNF